MVAVKLCSQHNLSVIRTCANTRSVGYLLIDIWVRYALQARTPAARTCSTTAPARWSTTRQAWAWCTAGPRSTASISSWATRTTSRRWQCAMRGCRSETSTSPRRPSLRPARYGNIKMTCLLKVVMKKLAAGDLDLDSQDRLSDRPGARINDKCLVRSLAEAWQAVRHPSTGFQCHALQTGTCRALFGRCCRRRVPVAEC